jgi:hypothetical protein
MGVRGIFIISVQAIAETSEMLISMVSFSVVSDSVCTFSMKIRR